MKIRYFDIAWLSKVDGPGNRVVLFLQGCHLRCPWCHSPHSRESESPILFNRVRCKGCLKCVQACERNVHIITDGIHQLHRENCIQCGKCIEACPTSKAGHNAGALSLPTKVSDVSEVCELLRPQLEVIKKHGGLTISGGEALLQKEAVLEILMYCKENGIHTAVETSLTLPTEVYFYVSRLVDCWLIGMRDISLCKGNNCSDLMLKNVRYISSLGKEIIVRLPVINGYTGSASQLERLAALMYMGNIEDIEVLPCNKHMAHFYNLSGIKPELMVEEALPDEAEINRVARFFRMGGFNASVVS